MKRNMKKAQRFLGKETLKAILLFKRDYLLVSVEKIRKLLEEKKEDRVNFYTNIQLMY